MSRVIRTLFLVTVMAVGVNLSGQEANGKTDSKQPGKSNTAVKRIFMPPVYLGHSEYWGGPISKNAFDSLVKQGLISHDSLGNPYKIVGFDFAYAERKLYEDSVGNLGVYMDYSSEHCFGDTLSRNITARVAASDPNEVSSSLFDRSKEGDTVYFDHIKIVKYLSNSAETFPDSTAIAGKGLKCVIIK